MDRIQSFVTQKIFILHQMDPVKTYLKRTAPFPEYY